MEIHLYKIFFDVLLILLKIFKFLGGAVILMVAAKLIQGSGQKQLLDFFLCVFF